MASNLFYIIAPKLPLILRHGTCYRLERMEGHRAATAPQEGRKACRRLAAKCSQNSQMSHAPNPLWAITMRFTPSSAKYDT